LALDVDVRKEDRGGSEVVVPLCGLDGRDSRAFGPPFDDTSPSFASRLTTTLSG